MKKNLALLLCFLLCLSWAIGTGVTSWAAAGSTSEVVTPTPIPTVTNTPTPTPTATRDPLRGYSFRDWNVSSVSQTSAIVTTSFFIEMVTITCTYTYWDVNTPEQKTTFVVTLYGSSPGTYTNSHSITGLTPGTTYKIAMTLTTNIDTGVRDYGSSEFTTLSDSTQSPTITPTPTPVPPTPTPTPFVNMGYVFEGWNIAGVGQTTATVTTKCFTEMMTITCRYQYWDVNTPEQKTTFIVTFSGVGERTDIHTITGLTPGTTYEIAMSYGIVGTEYTYAPQQFTTLPVSTEVPTITPTPTPVPPTPTPTPTPATGNIKVQFFNGNTAATSNTLYPNFKLVNTGTTAVTLSNVKLRYYFTNDGTQANSFACDYATVGSGNVTGSFVTTAGTNADRYLEVSFTGGAGSLAAGAGAEVKGRVWKPDWSNFTQTNDYSFNATAANYTDWTRTTGYVNGTLAWGMEP